MNTVEWSVFGSDAGCCYHDFDSLFWFLLLCDPCSKTVCAIFQRVTSLIDNSVVYPANLHFQVISLLVYQFSRLSCWSVVVVLLTVVPINGEEHTGESEGGTSSSVAISYVYTLLFIFSICLVDLFVYVCLFISFYHIWWIKMNILLLLSSCLVFYLELTFWCRLFHTFT